MARNLAYESTNGESPLSQIMRVHAARSLTHVAVSFNSEGVRLPLFFSEQPVGAFPALVLLNSLLVSRTFAKCQQLLPFSSLCTHRPSNQCMDTHFICIPKLIQVQDCVL